MKFLFKIILGISILLAFLVGIVILSFSLENSEESKFYNIKIPENLKFEKTIEFLSNKQIDSLKKLKVETEKIFVVGNGYSGYSFFMWHKPTEKGEIYIKAYEMTQKIQLSESELSSKTKNKINELGEKYKLYNGNSLIFEGTFANFYPVRFELWFKSEITGNEKKMAEKNYVIDGWDR
jgi:hypothetical protein